MTDEEPTEESCIGLQTTVCANGVVNVKRPESDRAHSVFIDDDGEVIRCSCKGHHYRGHCSHADAIESRPLVVASARAAAAETQQVATDGGQHVESIDDEPETCDRCPTTLADAHDEPAGYTVETTDGEELCPDCADARCGAEIGFGRCERDDCPYCDDESDDEPDLTAETCQSPTSKEWCNGPANADDPERDTCILCKCYADPDVSNPGDESRASEGAEPTRTERADFGGGESTGVIDL